MFARRRKRIDFDEGKERNEKGIKPSVADLCAWEAVLLIERGFGL